MEWRKPSSMRTSAVVDGCSETGQISLTGFNAYVGLGSMVRGFAGHSNAARSSQNISKLFAETPSPKETQKKLIFNSGNKGIYSEYVPYILFSLFP